MARVLICGSRDWTNRGLIAMRVSSLLPGSVVIEGECRGADIIAREEAEKQGVPVERYLADWQKHGRAAGPIRNTRMLEEGKPDLVIAFHNDIQNSRGTNDMVRKAKAAGIEVQVITE